MNFYASNGIFTCSTETLKKSEKLKDSVQCVKSVINFFPDIGYFIMKDLDVHRYSSCKILDKTK